MYSKKGVIEIQFNWIFVLIAGFVIITIFTTIIVKQRDISEKSKNAMVINHLDAILSGSEVSTGTVNVVKLLETKIEFAPKGYSVGDVSKQFNALNVFTPSVLEGTNIITMTLEWSVPYRATNFVYLTNNKIRYVFVGDPNINFNENIFDSIPEEINKEDFIYPEASSIRNKDDDAVRIIFFDNGVNEDDPIPALLNNMKEETITALKITGDENTGTLKFFEVENGKFKSAGDSYYIKEETLLGAIFTDDIEIYNAVMENAFKKLNIVSEVYEDKVLDLKDETSLSRCGYNEDPIEKIIIASEEFEPSVTIDKDTITDSAKNLEEQNKNLLRKSCPLIY